MIYLKTKYQVFYINKFKQDNKMKIFNNKTADETAEKLLEIKAVKLNPENPFTWASGLKSPIYCDNRKILSFPETRNYIKTKLAEVVKSNYSDADVIAGVATGAIAMGALVADMLNKPFIYIRAASKKHGLGNRIEGVLDKNDKVIIIEDLVSTGMSSLSAVDAIKEFGSEVIGMCAVFTYGLGLAEKNFKNANCDLTVLSEFDVLSKFALENNYITDNEYKELLKWRENQ